MVWPNLELNRVSCALLVLVVLRHYCENLLLVYLSAGTIGTFF